MDDTGFKVPVVPLAKKKKVQHTAEENQEPEHSNKSTPSDLPNTSTITEDELSTKQDEPSNTTTSPKEVGNFPPVPYTVPHWSAMPTQSYFLSVIKTGTLINEISLSDKPFLVFGRLPSCDVQLEHPSLSRYHAVLQYGPPPDTTQQSGGASPTGTAREPGFYVYDLGSTHGTYVNKTQVSSRVYVRVRVGQMVKFGGSSRLFLLESGVGGQCAVESSAQDEIQDILRQKEEAESRRAEAEAVREQRDKERESMGVMWGMGEQ